MLRPRYPPLLVTMLCLLPFGISDAQAQRSGVSQKILAERILEGSVEVQDIALAQALNLRPEETGPELRRGLITALERQGNIRIARARAGARGEILQPMEAPEIIGAYSRAVARLHDPAAIPALTSALGTGFTVIDALAGFGEMAAGAVLEVALATDASIYAIDDALITLRFMVENAHALPLSKPTRRAMRAAAKLRLTVPGRLASTGGTLRWAIDLAIALDDPGLRANVEAYATDRDRIIAYGITDPQTIALTQKWAAERLAGVPPLPRP